MWWLATSSWLKSLQFLYVFISHWFFHIFSREKSSACSIIFLDIAIRTKVFIVKGAAWLLPWPPWKGWKKLAWVLPLWWDLCFWICDLHASTCPSFAALWNMLKHVETIKSRTWGFHLTFVATLKRWILGRVSANLPAACMHSRSVHFFMFQQLSNTCYRIDWALTHTHAHAHICIMNYIYWSYTIIL